MSYELSTVRYTRVPGTFSTCYPAVTWIFDFTPAEKKMRFRFAVCNGVDTFSKKIGKDLASRAHAFECDYDPGLSLVDNALDYLAALDDLEILVQHGNKIRPLFQAVTDIGYIVDSGLHYLYRCG